ncbi:MAG: insulinase family protein [Deltaproteobacteria bacterium]|nr:insulinase family protein [Deltaproteobacteria bacterium]
MRVVNLPPQPPSQSPGRRPCRPTLVALLAMGLVLLAAGGAWAQAQAEARPQRFRLDNGLRVLLLESRATPVVGLNLWVHVGSGDESDDLAGMAHVMEHMLFKGTETRPVGQIAREIEGAGGEINAYTSFDETVYYIVLASRFWELGLDILADGVLHPVLQDEDLRREKEVVLEELRMGRDSPGQEAGRALYALSYRAHPYRRPVIGFEETVRGFTREQLLGFYQRWYVPGNMLLVMVGDFDTQQVLPRIRALFGKAPARPGPSRARAAEPVQRELRFTAFTQKIQQSYLRLGFHIPALRHGDVYALDVLSILLGQGESSRLYRQVKDRGLVHAVSASSYTPQDPGLFEVAAVLAREKLREALRALLREVFLLKQEPAGAEELRKAKLNIQSDAVRDRETVQGMARKLGYYEMIAGDMGYERESLVEEVDHQVAASTPARRAEEIRKAVLPNGMTVLIREDHRVPLVALRAVFLGGLRSERPKQSGLTNFVAEMLTKGTRRRSAAEIAAEVESMAGSLSGFSGRNSFGVEAEGLSDSFDRLLDLVADVLIGPTFPAGELEKKRRDLLAAIERREDQLSQVAFDLFRQKLYPSHPYGLKVLGEASTVKALTREALRRHYARYARPGNLVLALVGDVQADAVLKQVRAAFAGFKGAAPRPPALGTPRPPRAPVRVFTRKEKEQIHLVLGFLGTTMFSPDRFALEVLNGVLAGMGGRLFTELRDKQSLAYSVSPFEISGLEPGAFGVYMGTSRGKLRQSVEEVLRLLREAREQSVGQEELDRAKRSLVGAFEINLQRLGALASHLAFDERYGLGYDYFRRYPEQIMKVTAEDVQRVARKYLDLDRYVLAVVGPEGEGL